MKIKFKNIALISVIVAGIGLTGCTSSMTSGGKNYSNIEKVAMRVLAEDELVSIKEVELKKSSGKKKKVQKDLNVTLNLPHSAKDVAVDNALLKSTRIISILEESFGENLNNYNFIVNTTQFDVYGNEQKVKILEISIDNSDVEKINFENFDYRNLEKISKIKKYNYLKDDESNKEVKENNKDKSKEELNKDTKDAKVEDLKNDEKATNK